jgi:hypothetical protein
MFLDTLRPQQLIPTQFPCPHTDRDLLFIISMLRRSTLTSALNNAVKDVEANDLDELRQFGKGLRVQVNEDGVLDVIHDEQGDQGDTKGPPKSAL